jgi:kinesin family protein 2/24
VEDHQVAVCVRKRPLSRQEMSRNEVDVISVPKKDLIIVHGDKQRYDGTKYLKNDSFKFDYAFNEECSNAVVYKYTAKPLVQVIFEGQIATCFAYGQTGSSKTHTMCGNFEGRQYCNEGIYAMASRDIFQSVKSPTYKGLNLEVYVSFFEIYNKDVFDLLAEKVKKLPVHEHRNRQCMLRALSRNEHTLRMKSLIVYSKALLSERQARHQEIPLLHDLMQYCR